MFVQTGSWCFYLSIGTLHTVPRPFALVLGHFTLSQDLVLGHLALSQDLVLGHLALSQDHLLKRWDTSHCPKTLRPNVGTLRTVPRPSVGTPRTVPRPYTQVFGHFTLSQDYPLKRWDTSHCPKTLRSSVGTLYTVPRPSVGTPRTVPRPYTQVLGHFTLSQDHPLKRWDTSYCLKTLPLKCWDTSYCPKTLPLKCWDTSYCPKALPLKFWDTSHCPKTTCSSIGTLRIVPGPPTQDPSTQVLGHFALSQDYLLKCWDTSYSPKTSSFICWDSRFPSSSVLGHLDHYLRYQHLSPSVKNFPKPILLTKIFLPISSLIITSLYSSGANRNKTC